MTIEKVLIAREALTFNSSDTEDVTISVDAEAGMIRFAVDGGVAYVEIDFTLEEWREIVMFVEKGGQ